ncbi:MAG: radical SAM protein, partial [Acidobacteriota bacterium]|nr:radical SAM protein [Acidobacteriota bacterium]
GGAPHPIWAYARVSDLPEETVELMARAGVKQVFIGQESGDQVILDRMRKGTRLKHVRPAVAALARNNLTAVMGFIHGYPGETLETIRTTRQLLVSINEGHERRPPVVLYTLSPFYLQDMAGAAESERAVMQTEGEHFFDYRFGQFTSRVLADECLTTIIAAGKNPSAPANMFLFGKEKATTNSMILGGAPYPHEVFRWVKTLERGLVTFLESYLEGTPLDGAELRRVKETLLTYYPHQRSLRQRMISPLRKSVLKNQTLVVKRLAREWHDEENQGIGRFTRLMLTSMALRDSGKVAFAWSVWRNGSYIAPAAASPAKSKEDEETLALAAKAVVDEGLQKGRAKLKILDAEGHIVPNETAIRAMAGAAAPL